MSETISEARGGNVLQKALRNKRVLNVISIVLFLGIWDLIVVVGNATMMPRPWEVVTELIDMFQSRLAGYTLLMHTWISFRRVMIAFLLAAVIGIPLGVLMGFNKTANAIVRPIFEFFKQCHLSHGSPFPSSGLVSAKLPRSSSSSSVLWYRLF